MTDKLDLAAAPSRRHTIVLGTRTGKLLDSAAFAWTGPAASETEARTLAKADVDRAWRILLAQRDRGRPQGTNRR